MSISVAATPAAKSSLSEKLAANDGFHALVSYTDLGFEPTRVEISADETVRFTNNSSKELWVASDSAAALYPQRGQLCGGRNLDTCGPITALDFWEFTFSHAGEWYVRNNLDKTQKVLVVVE